jgi:CRP-like cAMP-binding protein
VPATTGNLLLDALSPELRETVLTLAKPVDLPARTLLHEQGETSAYVYFLTSGVASLVVTMAEGGSAEVGLIGHEGVVGAMQLLGRTPTPAQSFLLMEGAALRVKLDELRALFQTSGELRCKILEFV